MRKTRLTNLLFLVLSLAFFCVPEFRQSLQVPIFAGAGWRWLERAGQLPQRTLDKLVREGEQQRDARTLAFVALRLPRGPESTRLASQAVALDRQLTWVYWDPGTPQQSRDPKIEEQKIKGLQVWDPDNAIPYLFEGERIFEMRALQRHQSPDGLGELAKENEWRQVMAKAFAAPRYDSYVLRRFDLERALFQQHGLDNPVIVLRSLASYSIPSLLNVRTYGRLLAWKLAKDAEQAGRLPEAMSHYWTVAHFGERLHAQGRTLVEKRIGEYLQTEAYPRLIPLLRQMGRADEAATVEYMLQQLRQRQAIWSGQEPLAQSSNYNWAALTVHLFAGLVVIFGLFTVLCIGYVNAKPWVRPEKKGRLYQLFSIGENYGPVLLFLACLALYVSYYPYAQNFKHYMTASGGMHDFEPFFFNVFPTFGAVPGRTDLAIENPFWPYVWYALGGLALALGITWWLQRRGPTAAPAETPKAAAS